MEKNTPKQLAPVNGTPFDYLRWRGDLTFARDGFNEVDNLVLCILSYINFRRIDAVHTKDPAAAPTLAQVAPLLTDEDDQLGLSELSYLPLLRLAAQTERFRDLRLFGYTHEYDEQSAKQFDALSFLVPDGTLFVAFMGTDTSLAGWKEDFNMAFQSPIPSQTEAVVYLRSVAENTDGNLILGGHSKGGNLAVYAAAYADEQTKQRIQRVYSHDGPGFLPQVLASDEFKSISDKIDKTVPQSSFVGMLLEAQESFRVIKSNRSNIMQHDPFSWETDGCEFVPVASLTATAGYLDKTLNGWINGLSESERKRLVDLLFAYVDSQNVANIDELLKYGKKNIVRALRAVSRETAETQKFVKQTIRSLLSLSVKNFPELLKDNGKSKTSNKDN